MHLVAMSNVPGTGRSLQISNSDGSGTALTVVSTGRRNGNIESWQTGSDLGT